MASQAVTTTIISLLPTASAQTITTSIMLPIPSMVTQTITTSILLAAPSLAPETNATRPATELSDSTGWWGLPRGFWLLALLIAFVNYSCFHSKMSFALYTVLHVLPTLAAVEDTSATIQDEVEKSEEAVTLNEKSGHNLPASLDVKEDEYHLFLDLQRYVIGLPEFSIQQPVSSSIGSMIQAFGTVGEDVVRGGTWYSAYNIARNLGMLLSFLCFPSWLAISTLIPMNLLLLRAHTYWRHSVISAHINPSHLRLARGSSMVILKYSPGTWLSFKATALPMSLYSLAICAWLFFGDFDINTLSSSLELIKAFRPIDLLGILVGLVATAAMWGLVIFPTMVVLIRVQASLLPDGEKTVVPFDRTFGVKRARARGYLTTVEAFRSVSWSKWVHLEMVFFKCAFLALGAMGLWLLVVGAEICALKGLYRYYGLL